MPTLRDWVSRKQEQHNLAVFDVCALVFSQGMRGRLLFIGMKQYGY